VIRNFLFLWRTFVQVRLTLFVFIGMSLLLGFTFFQAGYVQKGSHFRASLLYFSLIVTNLIVIPIMAVIIFQRAVYYRERAARAYRSFTYLFALMIANLPFLIIYTLLFSIPVYWLVGFQSDAGKFFIFLLVMILALMQNQALLAFIGVASPTMVIAFTIMAIVLSTFALFTGFLIKYQNMPVYWYWAYYIDFTAYPLAALLVNEFTGGVTLTCSPGEAINVPLNNGSTYLYCPLTTGDQFLTSFDYHSDDLWRNVGIMFALWGSCIVACALGLAWFKHIKR